MSSPPSADRPRPASVSLPVPVASAVGVGRMVRLLVEENAASAYNLDRKDPAAKVDFEHMPPERLVEDILAKERQIAELIEEIGRMMAAGPAVSSRAAQAAV